MREQIIKSRLQKCLPIISSCVDRSYSIYQKQELDKIMKIELEKHEQKMDNLNNNPMLLVQDFLQQFLLPDIDEFLLNENQKIDNRKMSEILFKKQP